MPGNRPERQTSWTLDPRNYIITVHANIIGIIGIGVHVGASLKVISGVNGPLPISKRTQGRTCIRYDA